VHSALYEAIIAAVQGRSNNFSDESHTQQINVNKTGVMLCRSTINGVPLGEKLSTLSMSDLEKINDKKTNHLNANTKSLMSAISTSCRAWATLKKRQSMPEGVVLHYWIVTD
jgi:hypothetical protein